MEERELIERVLRGEREVLESLFKKYHSSIFLLSFNILREINEAKDSVQETFLHALQNIKSLKNIENFKSWLYSIAYRIAIDRKRKMKIFKRKISEISNEIVPNKYKPEIWESLEELNSKERSAFLLHLEGFNSKEIGEIIGCSGSTARVHLFNARKKLKKILKEG